MGPVFGKSNKQAMVKEEQAILLIDAFRGDSRKVLISHQDDKLVSVRQSYGKPGKALAIIWKSLMLSSKTTSMLLPESASS